MYVKQHPLVATAPRSQLASVPSTSRDPETASWSQIFEIMLVLVQLDPRFLFFRPGTGQFWSVDPCLHPVRPGSPACYHIFCFQVQVNHCYFYNNMILELFH